MVKFDSYLCAGWWFPLVTQISFIDKTENYRITTVINVGTDIITVSLIYQL
jgi:hypothetical protein